MTYVGVWFECAYDEKKRHKAVSESQTEQALITLGMGFAVRVRSAGQKYGPTCHQSDRADVTEFVTLVRLSSLGQHVGVLALAGYKRRESALTAGPISVPHVASVFKSNELIVFGKTHHILTHCDKAAGCRHVSHRVMDSPQNHGCIIMCARCMFFHIAAPLNRRTSVSKRRWQCHGVLLKSCLSWSGALPSKLPALLLSLDPNLSVISRLWNPCWGTQWCLNQWLLSSSNCLKKADRVVLCFALPTGMTRMDQSIEQWIGHPACSLPHHHLPQCLLFDPW